MEESRAVLDRLERIEALDRAGAEPGVLVAELRALVAEATDWSQAREVMPGPGRSTDCGLRWRVLP